MAKVVTNLKVLTLTRTKTLYSVVSEIVEGVTGESAPSTIKEGILDNPYLAAVILHLVNYKREKFATVELHIDWEKHEIYSSTKGLNKFTFEKNKSIRSQISEAIDEILEVVENINTENPRVEVWYRVRDDHFLKPDEIRKRLGFTLGGSKQLEWHKGKFLVGTFVPESLDELSIKFKTKVE